MQHVPRIATATAAILAAMTAAPAAFGAPQPAPYEAVPAPAQASPVFSVRYTGSSRTQTTYRGTPPNPGGDADLNTARDRSRQEWALTYPGGVSIPECTGTPDPCAAVAGPTGAEGRSAASGSIDHRHVDGLYRQLDATERCSVRARAVPRVSPQARIDIAYDPAAAAFVVTPRNPVEAALLQLPSTCPQRPDGIDRILDNYFMPGFSFSPDYGAERWFTPTPVAVPAAVWHTSARIRIRTRLNSVGRPPRSCAARFSYERCRTTGAWSGTLTFTRR